MLTLGDARLALHLLISRGVPDGKAVSGWMQERGEAGRVIHLGGLVGARPVWVLLLFTNGSHMLPFMALSVGSQARTGRVRLWTSIRPRNQTRSVHSTTHGHGRGIRVTFV